MASEEINKYINKRYDRWLDYAKYHCSRAGMADEAIDVLNEVLCNLLQKSSIKLTQLYNKKSGQYTELDYFVLRMIKLNATSDTAPYRHKYRSIPVDTNVDYSQLDIEDIFEEETDKPAEILEQTRLIRSVFESLDLSDHAKEVFTFRFFCGEKFKDWPGEEKEKDLFETYYKIIELIKNKLENKTLL